ncbi:hypothetical protein WA026_008369 [Henosepilachna vigintioctopunctata]|uniref:Uncharacterized protein n=1 Tax=Henosepilachna vigintioctopunctata TaxID=420089 RepID=A0AAW1UBG2_9CUCU
MIRSTINLEHIYLIEKNLYRITNCWNQYSQRCNYDECDCIIPDPKCKKRPAVVQEVDCEECRYECWQYKPRPRFAVPKTQQDLKKSRTCTAGMKTAENVTVDTKCKIADEIDAPIGPCPKTFKGNIRKSLKENPYKFENERIPLPDWDFNKRKPC